MVGRVFCGTFGRVGRDGGVGSFPGLLGFSIAFCLRMEGRWQKNERLDFDYAQSTVMSDER